MMWKSIVGPEKQQMTIMLMRISRWGAKGYRHTLMEYVIIPAFVLLNSGHTEQWSH